MKRIICFMVLVMFLIIAIPLIILGGVGPGIKIPGIINRITSTVPEKDNEKDSDKKPEDSNGTYKIKVYDTYKNKIVEMDIEEYVKGVVAAEMPASSSIEALKAQAVAARTFAVALMISTGGGGCKEHPGCDICSDIHCQAWISKEERYKSWPAKDASEYWKKIEEAVNTTSGMVLTYKGEITRSIKYHSTSGGKTEDSINVFGYSEPYLKSVESPNEEEAPSYISTVTLRREEFIKRIKGLDSEIKITNATLPSKISIISRTEGGRVKSIKIGDKTFSGIDIRWAMGLKSANFTVKVDSKNVVFNVKGYGHGVGMSQWGAMEMAKRGKKYDEILKHYYSGIEINKIDNIFRNKN